MKLIPYKEFTIETPLSKDEVIERLNSLKRPKKKGFWNKFPEVIASLKKPKKRYYTVDFKGDKFTITIDFNISGLGLITDFFRGKTEMEESHEIHGELQEKETGTNIKMGFKPPYLTALLYKLFLLPNIAIGAYFIYTQPNTNYTEVIISIIQALMIASPLPLGLYLLLKNSLNNYYKPMKPFLTELFETN